MVQIAVDLSLNPVDALAFFRRKGTAIAFDYTDLMGDKNVQAFTVAKATTDSVLGAIRAEVDRGIKGEITFEQFKKELRPRLQALGWWGKSELLDGETGEISKVQLGSDRRLRTIFQTNVQTAYMAGRYKRYLDNAVDRPYWRYVAILDGRTRPAHAALHGKVWRFDDPIWAIIWPPNGWGCRCRIQALTEAEFQALGVPLERGEGAIVEFQVPVNRDGDLVTVKGVKYTDAAGKEKIFKPDPGWDYNPGEAWSRFDPGAFKSEDSASAITPRAAGRALKPAEQLKMWSDEGRPSLQAGDVARLDAPELLAVADTPTAALQQQLDLLVGPGETRRVVTTPIGDVVIRPELLPAPDAARDLYIGFVVPTLRQPLEVWLTAYADGTYRKRYLAAFQGDRLVMVRENRDGSIFWEVFDLAQGDGLRKGTLIYVRPAP